MSITITSRQHGGLRIVRVAGELDVETAPALRRRLAAIVEEGDVDLVVDLRDVGFLGASGLGVLVEARSRLRVREGSLRLVCVDERILMLFRITGLSAVLAIYPSVEDAAARARRTT